MLGLAVLLGGGVWWWSSSDSTDADQLDTALPRAPQDGPASGDAAVPDGDHSVSVTREGPPPEAARRCTGSRAGRAECRIVGSLVGDGPPVDDQLPLLEGRPATLGRPAIADAADPDVLVDGLTYYFFSTSAEWLNVPVATVPAGALVERPDGSGFEIDPDSGLVRLDGGIERTDAMPTYPPWAIDTGIWAPTVEQLDGRYVMFFAAKRPNAPDPINQECIGRAVASRPSGPYRPDPEPFTCGISGIHGALDPAFHRDHDGSLTLHVAYGGSSTPLWSIPLAGDGSATGPAEPLLPMQQPWEYWFLENPSMIHDGTHYLLAYSAGDWRDASYSTGLARCRTPRGPCRSDPSGPWLASSGPVTGPGGLAFFHDVHGDLMAVHHGYPAGGEAAFGARSTFIRRVELDDVSITLR